MKLIIDDIAQTLEITGHGDGEDRTLNLYSKEAFEVLSRQWLKVGWNEKYSYCFSWLGRPVIQLPEDLLRIQEVIYQVKPDVIVETGVAHGGSLVFYASLFKAMGKGRVIGVDIEIRPHNRQALEAHQLADRITLIEGDCVASATVSQVEALIQPHETVLVILDSCHTKAHVANELAAYHHLVSPGSYVVATDGAQHYLHDVPRGTPDWSWDHPTAAAEEFAAAHPEFGIEQPDWPFNESALGENITHWPGAYLKRLR
ncbi:MAG: hydroxylase [Gammaproteobacteria bacterium]|nr:hydroxylase [Gammaproteobacteria bacterium]